MILKLQHFDSTMARHDDLMPRGLYLFVEGNVEGEEHMFAMVLERTLPFTVWNDMMEGWTNAEDEGLDLAKENDITIRDFEDLADMAGAIAGGMALLVFGREGSAMDRRKPVEGDEEETSSEAEEVPDAS
jgi:hypothetical protein